MITTAELEKLHDAAKMIEYDADEAYHSCCQKFGTEVANALLVAFFRQSFGPPTFPEQKGLREKVNAHLKKIGLLEEREVSSDSSDSWFLNSYRCSECGEEWQDEWDCMCNDRCPKCNAEIEPYTSEQMK